MCGGNRSKCASGGTTTWWQRHQQVLTPRGTTAYSDGRASNSILRELWSNITLEHTMKRVMAVLASFAQKGIIFGY